MGKHRKISTGDRFGRLEVLECLGIRDIPGNKRGRVYKCKCKCNAIVDLPGIYLGRVYNSCSCLQKESRQKDIPPGTIFDRLEVIEKADLIPGKGYLYLCQCECDTQVKVRGDLLRSGETGSCGCLHDDLFDSHKKSNYKKMFVEETSLPKITNKKAYRNNRIGVKGVSIQPNGKYQARIGFQGKNYHLGTFDKLEAAADARKKAEEKYFKPTIDKYKSKEK